jgi:hypothetical protein
VQLHAEAGDSHGLGGGRLAVDEPQLAGGGTSGEVGASAKGLIRG